MLTIPLTYDDTTRVLSCTEGWAGTTIDDRSTSFIVSGIPEDVLEARLDVRVRVKSRKGHSIHPFMRLDISAGVGTCTVPLDLLRATKRDLKFIIQLVIVTETETYASDNRLTFKVSPAIASIPSQTPLTDLGPLFRNAEGNAENQTIIFTRVNGDCDIVDVKGLMINDLEESEDQSYSSARTLELIQEYASEFAGNFNTHADLIAATTRPDGHPIDIHDYAIVNDDTHGTPETHKEQTWRYRCVDPSLLGSESAWSAEYQIKNASGDSWLKKFETNCAGPRSENTWVGALPSDALAAISVGDGVVWARILASDAVDARVVDMMFASFNLSGQTVGADRVLMGRCSAIDVTDGVTVATYEMRIAGTVATITKVSGADTDLERRVGVLEDGFVAIASDYVSAGELEVMRTTIATLRSNATLEERVAALEEMSTTIRNDYVRSREQTR